MNEFAGEIAAAIASTDASGDGELLPDLLNQVDDVFRQVSGDGAYDSHRCYEAIAAGGARATIPPRRGVHIRQHGNCADPPRERDENLRASVKLTDTGKHTGVEVVQLYVRDKIASVSPPRRLLRKFKRVTLRPGQSKTVRFRLNRNDLAIYQRDLKREAEPGAYQIFMRWRFDRQTACRSHFAGGIGILIGRPL